MRRKRRLLIVEDNADLRRLLAIGLNQRGFEVRLASNGAEGLDRVSGERPDLIILDLLMPVMDGWEMVDRVNPPDAEAIPVVVVSAHERPAARPLPPSIRAWIPKPATLEEIAAQIEAILSGAGDGNGREAESPAEPRRRDRKSVESSANGDGFVSHSGRERADLAAGSGAARSHRA